MAQPSNAHGQSSYLVQQTRSVVTTERQNNTGAGAGTSTITETVRVTSTHSTLTSHDVKFEQGLPYPLPVRLKRPVLREVNHQNLYSIAPNLVEVPPFYIRQKLPTMEMFPYRDRPISLPDASDSALPQRITMVLPPDGSVCPTHILALRTSEHGTYSLFPIHELIFASNCSLFPPLPPSPSAKSYPHSPLTYSAVLPVVPCQLPSPDSFDLFRHHLYSKKLDLLRSAFLPTGWNENLSSVMRQMTVVRGFWAIACAFGLYDMSAFDLIDEAWGRMYHTRQQMST